MKQAVLSVLLLSLSVNIQSDAVPQSKFADNFAVCRINGNRWLQASTEEQDAYLAGSIDALNMWRPELLEDKWDTHENWTLTQTRAVVKKWMDKNPEAWHNPMPLLVVQALRGLSPTSEPLSDPEE